MNYDHISHFDYELPEELIAQTPLADRSASRLLVLETHSQSIQHRQFSDLVELLRPNDLLIVNDTKVIAARLYGNKKSGGRIECLVERILSKKTAWVHLKSSKSPRPGSELIFSDACTARVLERKDDLFLLLFSCENLFEMLEKTGHIPLPPYMKRIDTPQDKTRYQTVYAKHEGAVAAPTAGLHFTPELMCRIRERGVSLATVTLHVGAGTFQPIRVEHLDQHQMHHEYLEVHEETCRAVEQCRKKFGRIIVVGTTTLRALETASKNGYLAPFNGDTNLFIRPGYRFQCADILITNFHLPKSSLLMLVTAFGGYDFIMHSYQEAIRQKYRFYSYGDAMFIVNTPKKS